MLNDIKKILLNDRKLKNVNEEDGCEISVELDKDEDADRFIIRFTEHYIGTYILEIGDGEWYTDTQIFGINCHECDLHEALVERAGDPNEVGLWIWEKAIDTFVGLEEFINNYFELKNKTNIENNQYKSID